MISRRFLKRVARGAIAVLMFAQGALALAACESMRRDPAHAIAQAGQAMGEARCHEPEQNVNLCVAHCVDGDQSLDKPGFPVPAFVAAPVLAFSPMVLAAEHGVRDSRFLPPAAGPPPRIRFQTLLL